MLAILKKLLSPPQFANEEDSHQAYLLHVILCGLVIVPIPYMLYFVIFVPQDSLRVILQGVIGEVINISLFVLLRRGYIRFTSIAQVVAFWLFFTISAFTDYGVMGEAYLLGYPLVIVITGVLLGGTATLIVTTLSLFSGLGMLYAQSQGMIIPAVERSSVVTWILSFAIFPMGAALQYLSSRTVKKALQRVHLSEEKYRLISRVSSDYTFESTVDEKGNGNLTWVAGAFEKMTGYNLEEYIAKGGWLAHVHPDDLEKDARDMEALMRNEDVISSEIRTFTKSGEIRWERIFAHPVWDEKENRLTGIVGAVQDVTVQREADEMLKRTLLQQNAILDNIPDMAWLKDTNGYYIAVNEQFSDTCGYKIEDIVGKTDYDIWRKDFADKYRQDDLEVMNSGKRRQIEETQVDNTGREYWVETIKTPIRNSTGEVIGTTGIAREITERKLAEIEREKLIAELEAKNAELERFTYTVSHDLKSPLVTITGFLSYLEKDARSGNFEKFNKDIDRIQQAVKKMQGLLKDLLELSRIGRLMNDPVEIGFGEIIKEALAAVDGQIVSEHISVEFVDDGQKIRGDRIRLVEAMQNLLDNAIKFMGNQPNPRIKIGTILNGQNNPTFFVQDNGIGIDVQYGDRIFGLFNKLDSNTQGSGVGLTIVKRIIEVHGGKIWVESTPGKGSTFYFTVSN
jgi:PAS domain S-box-containing protein